MRALVYRQEKGRERRNSRLKPGGSFRVWGSVSNLDFSCSGS